MNLFQRIFAFFGAQYVFLVDFDHRICCRRAKAVGQRVFARRHGILADTACELLPQGKLKGPIYVETWRPITSKTFGLYCSVNETPEGTEK